ncbi:hypothetical protein RclHR1_28270002 [Rhizophagus clarus]|uniref:Uncharacterized protein n=1 Tax=Rhizophagus clarus TaxID=94130 RepID=A0A2Z6RJ01_9GLOM|nr:hypothetical protein RclHR1_28270002 [Rhizophagus clarus]GES98212.1 hypothetical protein RCL_jg16943.t1 [Rhizophagus clarus]
MYMTQRSEEITSPWSIPMQTQYEGVLSCAVKIRLKRFIKSDKVSIMDDAGKRMRSKANFNMVRLTESNALEISWKRIHRGKLLWFASWMIDSRVMIGSRQVPPGNPAKLPPVRTS